MTFDPNVPPDSKEEWDAYIQWCAQELMLFVENGDTPRTYRTAYTCASKIMVITSTQLFLSLDTPDYETVLKNLARLTTVARAFERAQANVDQKMALLARSVLDCWIPIGRWAPQMLAAAKCATSAVVLTMVHPLEDLWDLDAPDVWTLVIMAYNEFDAIEGPLSHGDYTVGVDGAVKDRMELQRANNVARSMGGPDLSPN